MTRMNWDAARRRDRVTQVGGLPATSDQRGAMTQDRLRPVGKKRAKQLGVCRRCRQRFTAGDYVEPFTGRTRGGPVWQHQRGFCP